MGEASVLNGVATNEARPLSTPDAPRRDTPTPPVSPLSLRLVLPTLATPVLKPPTADIGGCPDDDDVDRQGRTDGVATPLVEDTNGARSSSSGASSTFFVPHGSKNSGKKCGRTRRVGGGGGKQVKRDKGGKMGPPSSSRFPFATVTGEDGIASGRLPPPFPALESSKGRKKMGVLEPARHRLLSTETASEGLWEAATRDDCGGGVGGIEEEDLLLSVGPGTAGSEVVDIRPFPMTPSPASSSGMADGARR